MSSTVDSAVLRRTIAAHEEALERLQTIVGGLSDSQANWRPAEKAWSIAECLDHLNQTLGSYNERLAPVIAQLRAAGKTGGEPYGRGTFVGRFLVDFLRQPAKKASAPGVFQPSASELEISSVADTFRGACSRLIELAEEADGLALGAAKIASPVSRWFRLSVAQAFEVQELHTPRHLAQAERVMEHPEFPRS